MKNGIGSNAGIGALQAQIARTTDQATLRTLYTELSKMFAAALRETRN